MSSHLVQPMLRFLQKGPKEVSRKGVKRENRGFERYGGQEMKELEVEDLNKGSRREKSS